MKKPLIILLSLLPLATIAQQPFALNNLITLNQYLRVDSAAVGFGVLSTGNTHTIRFPSAKFQAKLTAGVGVQIAGNVISSTITADTTTAPGAGNYRIALTADSLLRVVNSAGKVFALQDRYQPWALKPVVIDSTLSNYTIVDNRSLNFVLASTTNFSNAALGKYNVYSSNLYYYLPKFISGYTIALNLPNPTLTSSANLVVCLMMNKRCTINFNYPIYYTLKSGDGFLTQDTDYGLSQMNPTLQKIPTTNYRARWFVSKDATIYQFYVFNNKWYIR